MKIIASLVLVSILVGCVGCAHPTQPTQSTNPFFAHQSLTKIGARFALRCLRQSEMKTPITNVEIDDALSQPAKIDDLCLSALSFDGRLSRDGTASIHDVVVYTSQRIPGIDAASRMARIADARILRYLERLHGTNVRQSIRAAYAKVS